MVEVIHERPVYTEDTGTGVLLAVFLVLFLVVLFLIFGLPALRNSQPAEPGRIDVNIEQPAAQPQSQSVPSLLIPGTPRQ